MPRNSDVFEMNVDVDQVPLRDDFEHVEGDGARLQNNGPPPAIHVHELPPMQGGNGPVRDIQNVQLDAVTVIAQSVKGLHEQNARYLKDIHEQNEYFKRREARKEAREINESKIKCLKENRRSWLKDEHNRV